MSDAGPAKPSCERSARLREHRHLVVNIARRVLARMSANVTWDDLMQAGLIGLNDAMSRFDDERGASFGTFASRRIEGAMLDELRALDSLPRRLRAEHRKLRATVQRLEHQLGRAPRAKEAADALGMPLSEFHRLLVDAGAGGLRNGDRPLEETEHESSTFESSDGTGLLSDPPVDPLGSLQIRQRLSALADALEQLSEREQFVIEMVHKRGLLLKEVGSALGVTESRVCQIHRSAVAKLRKKLKNH